MNTKPNQITEADVVGFFQSKQSELRIATGIRYSQIRMEVDGFTGVPRWQSYSDGGDVLSADTVDAAIAAQVAALSDNGRMERAKEKRERAALLLAEAEKLEATK